MMRVKSGQKGFTLVELVFVIAIVLVLVSIFLPLAVGKFDQANDARAKEDVGTIGTALISFLGDLKRFPACNSTDCDPLTASNNDLVFLAFGTGTGVITSDYPGDNSAASLGTTLLGGWILTATPPSDAAPARNNAYNHLAANNPAASSSVGAAGTQYNSDKWKGPYIGKISLDPFGFTYFAHVGAMEKDGTTVTGTSAGKGWVLSAGPNGVIDTATTATTLGSDDIGYILMSR